MRVFVSYSSEDAELVKRLQKALESRHIEAASRLDVPPGEAWSEKLDQASANADAFIFLLGAGASLNPQLQAEWRALLRNDWDVKKPMIPVLLHNQRQSDLPKFLTNRTALVEPSLDQLVEQVERVVRNPVLGRRAQASEQARAEQARRFEELRDFAEALRSESALDPDTIRHP